MLLVLSTPLSVGARLPVAGVNEGSISPGFTPRALNAVEPEKLPGLKRVFRCLAWSLDSLEPDLFLWLRTGQSSPARLPVGRWPGTQGQRCPQGTRGCLDPRDAST